MAAKRMKPSYRLPSAVMALFIVTVTTICLSGTSPIAAAGAAAVPWVACWLLYRQYVCNPLRRITAAIDRALETGGEEVEDLVEETNGEIARIGSGLNRLFQVMNEKSKDAAAKIGDLSKLSDSFQDIGLAVQATTETQFRCIEEIYASLDALKESIRVIADDAENLLISAETASSASQEISSTIKEVAGTTDSLDTSADTIHSAVNQIASSLRQVTANLVLLAELTSSAGNSAAKISDAIKSIRDHAREQAGIASDVKEAAATAGLNAMSSTKNGMEKIRQEVFTTNESIESLSSKSDQIGQIVGVIKDIAEETNLLALNAAILAAQSGEKGKTFAIISDKVRGLSRRSAESTKDIAQIISHVQREIELAGKAVKRSIVEVDNGVSLTMAAERVLQEIVAKAEISQQKSMEVESSIELQTKSVELNANAIENFKKMSADIKKALTKQSQAADEIVRAVKELRTNTGFVKQTISEQSKTSESIAETVNNVFFSAGVIATGTKEQHKLAEEMLSSMSTMKQKADSSICLSHDLETLTQALSKEPSQPYAEPDPHSSPASGRQDIPAEDSDQPLPEESFLDDTAFDKAAASS